MTKKEKILKQKVVAFLNRDEMDFLDKLGKDAWFSTGMKLSRTQLIEALVNLVMQFGVLGKGINSIEEFKKRILKAAGRFEYR